MTGPKTYWRLEAQLRTTLLIMFVLFIYQTTVYQAQFLKLRIN